jgi:hypothetical protein
MKGFLIRAGAAVVGLAVGVLYLGWLMDRPRPELG